MTRVLQLQSNFTVGELDPLLRSRVDLSQYSNALERAKNVIVQPQGGVRRRPGLRFLHDFGNSFSKFKIIAFEYSVTDSYTLVLVDQRIYVFKDGVLQTNINGSGNDYLATSITAAMLDELNYTQAVDTLILVHETIAPQRLVRNSDTSWTIGNIPLSFVPQYAFEIDTHNPTFTVTPSAISGNITITASSVTTDTGTAQGGSADTITLKAATSFTTVNQANGMFIEITAGTGVGQTRHIEAYSAILKIAQVYPAWDTAPDATSQYEIKAFKPAAVGEYLNVLNGFGRARYTEYVSDTVMKAYVEIPFFDTSAIASGDWESEHGWEDTWSDTRGWPRSVAFHEGRLYFGGSTSRPNTIWGSRVIDYFNFNPGTALDDDGVEATLNTKQLNAIVNMAASSDLRIFTTGGEFVVIQTTANPITPSNFLVRAQTSLGAKAGVPIEDLNGATVFVQRQGKSLVGFQFSDTVASYGTRVLSVLSSHLIKDPIDLTISRSSSSDESDRIFLVNSDGTMTVYSILAEQNVIAASEFVTTGTFLACAVENNVAYAVVSRLKETAAVITPTGFDFNISDAGVFLEITYPSPHSIAVNDEVVIEGMRDYREDDPVIALLLGDFNATLYNGVELAVYSTTSTTITIKISDLNPLGTGQSGSASFVVTDEVVTDYERSYLLERFDDTLTVDSAITGSYASSTTASHLAGLTVEEILDGAYYNTRSVLVSSPYTVTFSYPALESFVIGLGYDVEIKTMPVEPRMAQGSVIGVNKRVLQTDALVYESQNMSVNGKAVSFPNLEPIPGAARNRIAKYTGLKTLHGLLGFNKTGQITITQTAPLSLNLLGIEYRVSIGD